MWPQEIKELYTPVKPLGKGGFGDVWLGRSTQEVQAKDGENKHHEYVAIKMVDTSDKIGKAYAAREIEILQKLDHPHIVKLIRDFKKEEKKEIPSCSYIALSFAEGPTLEKILKTGGAVGIPFARVLSRQLISAVTYLHSHAVIHRDLKPDNVIVTGSTIYDDSLWDDGLVGEAAVDKNKWHIVLIDFGFVRALSKKDVQRDVALHKTLKNKDEKDYEHAEDLARSDRNHKNYMNYAMDLNMDDSSHSKRGRKKKRENLDSSISHWKVRNLSAVGNRNYAAPEIINGVHEKPKLLDLSRSGRRSRGDGTEKRRESLARFVSDYGMDADAYSLGMLLRYALTGVPPGNDVHEYVSMKNNIFIKSIKRLGKALKNKTGKNSSQKKKRTKKYRYSQQCPKDATLLVRALTLWDPSKRATVRSARFYPWIMDKEHFDGESYEKMKKKPILFLDVDV